MLYVTLQLSRSAYARVAMDVCMRDDVQFDLELSLHAIMTMFEMAATQATTGEAVDDLGSKTST